MKEYVTLTELQYDLQQGNISCRDVVNHHLGQIQKNAHLNAFLSVYDQEAIQQADLIDKKIQTGKAGKLAGLVVGMKDVLSHRHHPLQAASSILTGYRATFNATVIQRLLDEDAIIIGRQNCDEFGMGSSNENSAFGPVLNHQDTSRVSGGSSGGSAVAIQADMCRISLGSDTGGSVRQPAAFCGVIGVKPTYSRISRHGLIAYASSFDCVGILGKSLDDITLVLQIIAGRDAHDSTVSVKPVPDYTKLLQEGNDKKYRIAYYKEIFEGNAVQEDIRSVFEQKINELIKAGHIVQELSFPLLHAALPAYYILVMAEASANLARYDGIRYGQRSEEATSLNDAYSKTRTQGFGHEVKRRILIGNFVLSSDYQDAYYTKAQRVRRLIRTRTKACFENFDFIITPTTPTTAFRVGENIKDPMQMYVGDLFSVQANVAGIPAISIPCGTDKDNMPIGLQIMADDFEEGKLFQFSKILMNLSI